MPRTRHVEEVRLICINFVRIRFQFHLTYWATVNNQIIVPM